MLAQFSCSAPRELKPYGPGTLMTVSTNVTEAPRDRTLPFKVTTVVLPTVEKAAPACEIIVPTMGPPPAALIVAALPTCQKTFFACAPLTRMTLCGNATPGPP